MKRPHRRQFLRLAAGTAAFAAASPLGWAQSYPSRPVRIIVGYAPGGTTDVSARLIGQWLSERLGQPFIIDNLPGAGSNVATGGAVRAPADGYTLLLASISNAINATLYDKLNFNFIRDIVPVAGIIRVPNVMEVNPAVPAKTVSEFIAYAKANPGKVNFGSGGIGSSTHVSGELFKLMTGVNMVHIPYRGTALAVTDLIAGQVQVMFDNLPGSIEYARAGMTRALAVTTTARSEALPNLPTVADSVPGYEVSAWFGLTAPKNTPNEIIVRLNEEINAAFANAKMKERFTDLGAMALAGSPADFGKLISDETEKWGKVVRAANISTTG
jgi:tripartite-type tricarboxylate transporter receptor subunit TctC